MKYLPALLTLAAAASAIDIRLHTDPNCNTVGVWAYCTNWNPNTCCGVNDAAYLSVAFVAIPTNWNIETRAYTGGFCQNQRIVHSPEHASTVCLHDQDGVARLTGGGYGFTNRKSTLGASSPDECRPDGLVLEDGTNYATPASEMDQDLFSELIPSIILSESSANCTVMVRVRLANNGTTSEDMPEKFAKYVISE